MRTEQLGRLDREINQARPGPAEAYAAALERGLAACEDDRSAAAYLDLLECTASWPRPTPARPGRGRAASRGRGAEQGYACERDLRCRRAEILTRHGRLEEAAVIWDAVARDTPEDVWVSNNAGSEYGAIGGHEIALTW